MIDDLDDTPFWRSVGSIPDDSFPIGLHHFPLVALPDRGNMVVVTCCSCRRRARFTGHDIVCAFPEWLTRDACEWARALRCDGCASKRLNFGVYADASAQGFREGTRDQSDVLRVRRLLAWLPDAGLRLDDVAYILRDIDPVHLREAGMPREVIRLFHAGDAHCGGYTPTARPWTPTNRAAQCP